MKRRRTDQRKGKRTFKNKSSTVVAKPPNNQTPDNFSQVREEDNVFSENTIESMSSVLDQRLIRQLKEYLNFSRFTNIQQQSMVPIIERKDVFVKSATGSGKTVGFLVPILQQLINLSKTERISRKDGMRVLIVSPTRELSTQTYKVLEQLCRPLPFIVPGLIIGGTAMKSEKSRLRKGIVISIGTPGRLLYHLKSTNSFTCEKLQTIVLDEADKLLDMGFDKQIKEIYDIANLRNNPDRMMRKEEENENQPKRIQTLLVSATLSEKVQELSKWCLSSDQVSFAGEEMESMAIPSTLNQYFVKVNPKMRFITLVSFLVSKTHSEWVDKPSKILIFFSNCSCVDFYYELLQRLGVFKKSIFSSDEEEEEENGCPLYKLHGKMEQMERTKVHKSFVDTDSGILLTTDVLCRGIDLPRTDWVIQFDAAGQPFDYLHRVGRTSRIGKDGSALLFLMEHEMAYLKMLRNFKFSMSELEMPNLLEYLVSLYPGEVQRNGFKYGKLLQRRIEGIVEGNARMTELSKTAIIDFLRAYSTHGKNLKFIFHTKFLNVGKICGSFGMNKTPSEVFKKENRIDYAHVSRKFEQNRQRNMRKKRAEMFQRREQGNNFTPRRRTPHQRQDQSQRKRQWSRKRGRDDGINFGGGKHQPPQKRRKM